MFFPIWKVNMFGNGDALLVIRGTFINHSNSGAIRDVYIYWQWTLILNYLINVMVRIRVRKGSPDTRQNVKKIEFIRGKGHCQDSGPTS